VYDFVDPVIISLRAQMPASLLKAEAEGRSLRPAMDRLSAAELLDVLKIQGQINARYQEREAEVIREMIRRGLPIPDQFKPEDV
jgi:hypothetical protein